VPTFLFYKKTVGTLALYPPAIARSDALQHASQPHRVVAGSRP